MNKKIFKKNDIRGNFPKDFSFKTLNQLATIFATYLFQKGKILIAHDARLSSPYLYKTIIKLLLKKNKNLKIIKGKLMSTPMFYYLNKKLKTNGGIMITASHNPKNYNGFKIINKKNQMIGGEEILKLIKNNANK